VETNYIITSIEIRSLANYLSEHKRKDVIAELIKQQARQKSLNKERNFTYEALTDVKLMLEARSNNALTEEDDMVESDKKRLRDGRNKEAVNTCGYEEQQKKLKFNASGWY